MVGVERVKVNAVSDTSSVQQDDPYLAQTMVARQVAHQYWGQQVAPATGRDA